MSTHPVPGSQPPAPGPRIYAPYDDNTQSLRQIDDYPRSFTRVPSQPLIERPLSLTELSGPADWERRFASGLPVGFRDFSCLLPGGQRALGQFITVSGRVIDEDGAPLAGALIELWQANASGKYIHEHDVHQAPHDPNFIGEGRFLTDAEGCYEFRTIKPGGYPVGSNDWWWRPPHIHFSIFGMSWMDRFITQIYFPGEPLNEVDLLLNGIPDPEARQRVMFEPLPTKVTKTMNILEFRRDFVLRGRNATPQLP
jgi:protocatechuate 3,4-dioxygenase, beta subunit